MVLPAYHYAPLPTDIPTIRILEVQPSSGQPGEFVCRLRHVSLLEGPEYTALSYSWGAVNGTVPVVFLDGQGQRAELLITETLHSFFRQIITDSAESITRLALWVDAVCINQSDLEEKNSQVAMMHKIYHQAQKVAVWLGDGSKETETAMDIIPRLAAVEEQANLLKQDANLTVGGRQPLSVRLGLPRDGADEYMALVALLRNPWFARVWIIQEVAMATHVIVKCGFRSASWDDFVSAFHVLNSLNMIMPDPAQYVQLVTRTLGIIDARASKLSGHERDTLGTLLRCRSSLATNPRDKVYGLLGLTTDAQALDFRPDYKAEVHQTYIRIAFAIITAEGSLDVLGVPRGTSTSAVSSLPSWVPDWSTWTSTPALNRRDRPANCPRTSEFLTRNASRDTKPIASLHDGHLLHLHGYTWDHISHVGALLHSEDELADYTLWIPSALKFYRQHTQSLLNWEHMTHAHCKTAIYPPTGQPILEAYWQTITAGWSVEEAPLSTTDYLKWDTYHRPFPSLRRHLGTLATTSAYATFTFALNCFKQLFSAQPNSGFDRSLTLASNRRLVRSARGYLGLVPAQARVGDGIALVAGAGAPLVVRAVGAGRWELLGEGYVHGVMDGECWDAGRCGVVELG
ncbi:hypothetical protein LEMA_P109410.1 [Plenodomus lingam JN3]|uniref:Heterokaryon incompatibility domain-containing protein n=1 Tax=Leptosphaeria maculans (strain JN3 / isolate v23.1.3 / race Av1-4-5-6-7-8) TaxID=985895 RepID=E4ZZ81_LEPMJ|nr:hypothetical protein LEMA_P109410.1 [Plenodomus lingam JN3]CBX96676.1 hypothetical protein LEMA_P109410.1 [Plenodomus lingam JN3]